MMFFVHPRMIQSNTTKLKLRSSECEPFISDMKIKVDPKLYYYPDVVVTCDQIINDAYSRSEPRLIVEVMSPSTERIDRHEKLPAYQQIAGLQGYVLIRQDEMMIEIYRRQPDNQWAAEVFADPEEDITFASVALTLQVRDIYRNVRFEVESEE